MQIQRRTRFAAPWFIAASPCLKIALPSFGTRVEKSSSNRFELPCANENCYFYFRWESVVQTAFVILTAPWPCVHFWKGGWSVVLRVKRTKKVKVNESRPNNLITHMSGSNFCRWCDSPPSLNPISCPLPAPSLSSSSSYWQHCL